MTRSNRGRVEAFWNARPILSDLRTYAQAYRVSPFAVLGAALARATCVVPPRVVLPAGFGGAEASLNLFIALVGRSGQGKGGAENIANSFLDIDPEPETAMIGSGEGVSKLFAYKRNGKETGPEQVNIRDTVLFSVPEVDSLTALGDRTGATLDSQLRSAWSGERLGFAYADPTKTVRVERHRYRMSLVLGAQPLRSGPLLNDASGGMPQRFLWLPTWDEQAPKVAPVAPARWSLGPWPVREGRIIEGNAALLEEKVEERELCPLKIPKEVRRFLDEHRRKALAMESSNSDIFSAHAPLGRLKVAAALMALDSRHDTISLEDWRLAGVIEWQSNLVRVGIETKLKEAQFHDDVARGASRGVQNIKTREVEDTTIIERITENVRKNLAEHGEQTVREITNRIAYRDRIRLPEAFDTLLRDGVIDTRMGRNKGQKTRLIRISE